MSSITGFNANRSAPRPAAAPAAPVTKKPSSPVDGFEPATKVPAPSTASNIPSPSVLAGALPSVLEYLTLLSMDVLPHTTTWLVQLAMGTAEGFERPGSPASLLSLGVVATSFVIVPTMAAVGLVCDAASALRAGLGRGLGTLQSWLGR